MGDKSQLQELKRINKTLVSLNRKHKATTVYVDEAHFKILVSIKDNLICLIGSHKLKESPNGNNQSNA